MVDRIQAIKISKYNLSQEVEIFDQIIVEEPLQITLHYSDGKGLQKRKNIAITMRTPGEDLNLVRGFLWTESVIHDWNEIQSMNIIENKVDVTLQPWSRPEIQNIERNIYTSSSCGICGKASVEHISRESAFLPWSSKWKVDFQIILGLKNKLDQVQELFSQTGGNHAAALFDIRGNLIRVHEDVGRHNAMDKLIGATKELPLDKHIVLWSGRSSFELVQKAAKAGLAMVVSVGAPSSLAIDMAKEHGISLIGFLKKENFNVYAGKERITSHT